MIFFIFCIQCFGLVVLRMFMEADSEYGNKIEGTDAGNSTTDDSDDFQDTDNSDT